MGRVFKMRGPQKREWGSEKVRGGIRISKVLLFGRSTGH